MEVKALRAAPTANLAMRPYSHASRTCTAADLAIMGLVIIRLSTIYLPCPCLSICVLSIRHSDSGCFFTADLGVYDLQIDFRAQLSL